MMNESTLTDTLRQLIEVSSTADRPDQLEQIVTAAEDYFKESGLVIHRYNNADKPSIVISTHEGVAFDVLLIGHLDVIPAAHDQFSLCEQDGKLLGRGVCDMKGPVAVLMTIMRQLAEAHPQKSCGLMLTTDEEVSGDKGVGWLVKEHGYTAKVAIVPDAGQNFNELIIANKGVLHVKVMARGVAAHGSRPWLGENALEKLIAVVGIIQAMFTATSDDYWHDTAVLSTIHGGEATNQVPAAAEATIDIRLTEKTDRQVLFARIEQVALAHGCSVELLSDSPTMFTDPTNPYVKIYLDEYKKLTGEDAKLEKTFGANDGRFLAERGVPVILSRPDSGNQHAEGEWINKASLLQFAQLYQRVIFRYLELD